MKYRILKNSPWTKAGEEFIADQCLGYGPTYDFGVRTVFLDRHPDWFQRIDEENVREMTVADVEKLVGQKVKIVK